LAIFIIRDIKIANYLKKAYSKLKNLEQKFFLVLSSTLYLLCSQSKFILLKLNRKFTVKILFINA